MKSRTEWKEFKKKTITFEKQMILNMVDEGKSVIHNNFLITPQSTHRQKFSQFLIRFQEGCNFSPTRGICISSIFWLCFLKNATCIGPQLSLYKMDGGAVYVFSLFFRDGVYDLPRGVRAGQHVRPHSPGTRTFPERT